VGGAAAGLADAAGAAIPDEAKNDPTDYLSKPALRPNQVNPTTADPEASWHKPDSQASWQMSTARVK